MALRTFAILATLHRQKRIVDDVLQEGIEQPEGTRVLTLVERVGIIETEFGYLRRSIDDGFKRIEGWIKSIVTFGVGTVVLGLGTLSYKVMIYDVSVHNEMRSYNTETRAYLEEKIEKTISASEQRTQKSITASEQKTEKAITASEQKTEKAITASEQKTEKAFAASEQKMKSEFDNLKMALELAAQRQIGEIGKEIRSVVKEEVHYYMKARDSKD
ncbi:hypothetical protein BGX38DRAFT_1273965 [Terfezia claveryi]|nr:hypothetical protein BGX38DRAFT_1273965 [Terfezia claveryi]